MRVLCSWCPNRVRPEDTQVISAMTPPTGPGIARRACVDCIREHGLIPLTAYTERREAPPIPPRRTA